MGRRGRKRKLTPADTVGGDADLRSIGRERKVGPAKEGSNLPGARSRKSRAATEHRLTRVADMLLRGCTISEIAERLKMSVPTISLDVKEIRSRWAETQREAADVHLGLFLRELDTVKAEAWKEWERSKTEKVKVVTKYSRPLLDKDIEAEGGGNGGRGGNGDGRGGKKTRIGSGGTGKGGTFGAGASGEGWNVGEGDFDGARSGVKPHPLGGYDLDDKPILPPVFGPIRPKSADGGESEDEYRRRVASGGSDVGGDGIDGRDDESNDMEHEPLMAEVTRTVEGRLGDPRYLSVIRECIDKQAGLLGLNVTKVAPTDPTGNQSYAGGAIQDMMKLAEEVSGGAFVYDDAAINAEVLKVMGGGGEGGGNGGESPGQPTLPSSPLATETSPAVGIRLEGAGGKGDGGGKGEGDGEGGGEIGPKELSTGRPVVDVVEGRVAELKATIAPIPTPLLPLAEGAERKPPKPPEPPRSYSAHDN
jgi:transcriptional regulator with XRE-family HTH domain